MKLKVIGTGSKGNSYLLYNDCEALLIECGVNIQEIKIALQFNLQNLLGCLVTHEHHDHNKAIYDLLDLGVEVWATFGTHKASRTHNHHRAKFLGERQVTTIGNFKVMAFDVRHDAKEPCGFLIDHPETGKFVFITDTFYCPYKFSGLNNIIIEANYSEKIIDKKLSAKQFLRDRVVQSHMSLENCMDLLSKNDLSAVNNIVLIHLSDTNSDEKLFRMEVKDQTQKNVVVASNGMELAFDKTPF